MTRTALVTGGASGIGRACVEALREARAAGAYAGGALEGGPHGVTANAVCPAYVRTPLVEAQVDDQARTRGIAPAEVEERVFVEHAAIKRMLRPHDVAASVRWLASEAAWGITGSVHAIDLGWTAR